MVIRMHDLLKNNSIIICPNSYKKEILKYLEKEKLLLNIKFMTMNEYIKKIKFDYNKKTIYYLVKKKMKVPNAISYLNNLIYIDEKDYHNEKLDYLVSLKEELEANDLLIYDQVFPKLLKRFQIIIYGYGKLNRWQESLFHNYKVVDYSIKNNHFEVYNIKNIEDEVEFVFQRIIDLLNQGIDINKISLMNVDKEYFPLLKKYSKYYKIDVDIPNNDSLLGTVIGKKVMQLIEDNKNFDEIELYLKHYQDSELYKNIISILNEYNDFDLKDVQELIKDDFINTKISCKKYDNILKIKKVFDYVSDDEYIFLLGFNSPNIPLLKQDIDYITDNIKELVCLDKTEYENALIKENTINYLKSISHLVISYKLVTPFNTYYPSILLDQMDYDEKEYTRSFNYSIDANKELYTNYLDDYVKYGIKNKDLAKLFFNYHKNNYLEYDNNYRSIDKKNLEEYLGNELTLSYSSIDNYYKCAFKYYLNNVLKVNLYEETFMTIIGNIFHDTLRHMNDSDFDMEKQYYKLLDGKEFTNKEKFFLEKLKSDLKYIIEVIKKHQFISGFTNMLYEEKIDIPIKKSPYVHFKGFVDKIMFKEKNNETLVSIIDYKTGNIDIKINNLEFGLSMQLPIYLYLVKKSNLLQNIKFAGFYLQHILDINVIKGKKSVLEQKYDNLKLTGYSTNNIERLSCFDSTMENSEMIKGIKLNKNGEFNKNANVLSDEEIDEIIKLTEEKIIKAMDDILNGVFDINPKILNGKNVSCEFCDFKDICYLDDKNKVYLVSHNDDDNEIIELE